MKGSAIEKEKMKKAANYPWAEIVEDFEMTDEEKQEADKALLKLMEEFEKNKNQK